jgi:hypothetical protein
MGIKAYMGWAASVDFLTPRWKFRELVYQGPQLLNFLQNLDFDFLLISCLRHYATSWKVAGSNPDEVTGFFN